MRVGCCLEDFQQFHYERYSCLSEMAAMKAAVNGLTPVP